MTKYLLKTIFVADLWSLKTLLNTANRSVMVNLSKISLEHRKIFEGASFSTKSVAHRIERIDSDIYSPLKRREYDERLDIKDHAQWLIFLKGTSENCEITEESLSIELS
ncbi:hypothetical protein RF11_04740 [Thelohanellus kitauei]|uniref:Uncharacterized protein n=1 Tax=Thelohanellus kitauei TaxID=669202 RepID=A0A0C2JZA4_THEKT|nr:hypothetical protein RF11_04740 [Thelohanellus kitauei]